MEGDVWIAKQLPFKLVVLLFTFWGKLFVLDVSYFLPLRNCSLKPHITTGSDSFTVIVKHCNLSPEGLAECAKSFITEIDFVIHHARAHFFVIYLVSFWCLRQG